MPSGNNCPACHENIGIWPVFRAPLPNRIYCPHCRERLRYGDTGLLIVAAMALLIVVVVSGFLTAVALELTGPVALAVVVGVLLFGGAALEIVFVLILWYGSFQLEPVNRPRSEWDDEEF